MSKKELERELEMLKKRIEELEKRPQTVNHYHNYPYYYSYSIPYYSGPTCPILPDPTWTFTSDSIGNNFGERTLTSTGYRNS